MSDLQQSAQQSEDNYEIGRQLARGGMGSVILAEDRKLGRRVALKAMSLDAWSDEAQRRRFVREAQVLAHLAHPNIVPIYDLVWEDGVPQFYTMKLVEGRTLQQILDGLRKGEQEALETYSLDSLLTIFLKVCDAVGFAHSRGIVHRDMKPDNIMAGEHGEVLVMDWGLAGIMADLGARRITNLKEGPIFGSASGGASLTMEGAVLGTPRYMSPEQAAGRIGEIGPRSDIFALGGILYAILTLHPPVEGDSADEVLSKILSGDITPPARLSSSASGRLRTVGGSAEVRRGGFFPHCPGGRIPSSLSAVAMRALALDPADRYPSAEAVAADINAYRGGFATSAEEVTPFQQLVLLMKRHKTLGASALVILLVSVGFMFNLAMSAEAERRSAQAARENAEAERRTAYSATLAQALAARVNYDFEQARRLLDGIDEELRGFGWRLLRRFCDGDDVRSFQLGDGAGSEAQSLDLHPENGRVALISADGYLHLRDLEGREVVPPRRLPAPSDGELQRYEGLSYSPNRQRLAYVNGDVLQVLDAESLAVLHEETSLRPQFAWLDDDRLLYGFNGSVAAPPFPQAGAWILELGRPKGSDGQFLRTAFPRMCAPLAVSPDRRFFVLHRVNTSPESWERRLNVFPTTAQPGDEPILSHVMPGLDYPGLLAFSESGRYLAYTGGLYRYLSRSAHVLDIASGRILFDQEFGAPIHGIAIDPQERRLAIVSDDSVVRLYDFTRGTSPAGRTNTYDDDVAFARSEPVSGVSAHAPPRDLLTRSAQDGRARFLLGHEGRVFDLSFDEKRTLITSGKGGAIRRWTVGDLDFRTPAVRIGHMECTYDREFPAASSDGSKVLYFGSHGVHVCDAPASHHRLEPVVKSVAWAHSPLAVLDDGRVVTLAWNDSVGVLWEEVDGVFREQRRFQDPSGKLPGYGNARGGKLSRDQTRLAGALPGQLFTIDLTNGRMVSSPDLGQRTGPQGVANHDLSPDGHWIAASGFGPRISIHRFEDPGEIVTHLGGPGRDFDTAVAFGRDGKLLYTGSEDGRVRVWETESWTEIPELGFAAHRGAVTALAVSNDRALIATSGDSTLKLFPIEPEPRSSYRRERLSFEIDQPANWIHFARGEDGGDRALLHSSPGRTLEEWPADAETPPAPVRAEASPDLPRVLMKHAMVTLPDGRVLVVGGEGRTSNEQNIALSHCYLFDPETGSCSATGSLRRARSRTGALTVLPNGKVLVVGGVGREGEWLQSCELYDPKLERWEFTGSMQTARYDFGLVPLADGEVLVVGGMVPGRGALTSCERYDSVEETWSPVVSLAQGAGAVNAVSLGAGRVFAVTRESPQKRVLRCELYDPVADRWTPTSPLQARLRSPIVCALHSGEVLVAGGISFDSPPTSLTTCRLYDPQTDSWRETGSMVAPANAAYSAAVTLPDGRVLVTGAKTTASGSSRGVEVYDPVTGEWSPASELAVPRGRAHVSVLQDGRVLLAGGADDKGVTNRVEVYEPPSFKRHDPSSK